MQFADKRVVVRCEDCGRRHIEIFLLRKTGKGLYRKLLRMTIEKVKESKRKW